MLTKNITFGQLNIPEKEKKLTATFIAYNYTELAKNIILETHPYNPINFESLEKNTLSISIKNNDWHIEAINFS